jgi:hypothetical protein
MTCADARAIWESEPLETLAGVRRAELDSHADACRSCRGEIRLLEGIRDVMPEVAVPYGRRRSFRWVGAAAAALLAVLYLFVLVSPANEVAGSLGAHLAVSEAFCRQAERVTDGRVLAAEWEASGLRAATASLDPESVRARYGEEPARYVAAFRKIGGLIEAGRPVEEIRAALAASGARELAVRLKPSFEGSARVARPAGTGDAAQYGAARASWYEGRTREAETLFDLLCDEHPASPFAPEAAYWGARSAGARGDRRAMVQFVSRLDDGRVDDAIVADVKAAGARIVESGGRRMLVVPVDGVEMRVAAPGTLLDRISR